MDNAPARGFSAERIGFVISLNDDGTPVNVTDLRDDQGRKKIARLMQVPQPPKRTSAIAPNFLWDKTSYSLGITAGEGKRVSEEHAAFTNHHLQVLKNEDDAGLKALCLFLRSWTPDRFSNLGWPEDMKDQNVVFALERDRRRNIFIHDRVASKAAWAAQLSNNNKAEAVCLVAGKRSVIARLHPAIKGVWGAQSSGASIVSFNLDAFASYGHEQGDNAPISEQAAFAYTTALNTFLQGKKNRIQIGDTTTVFWADASSVELEAEAEGIFAAWLCDVDERREAKKIAAILEQVRRGQPLKEFAPGLEEGVRFHVLGLAPNASRLSIRFWLEDDFGTIEKNFLRFVSDMRIEPSSRDPAPALWKYLAETAVLGKRENVPPNLAGEWMRAILSGTPYPLTLLSTVLMRLRADKNVSALRVGILKSLLIRNLGKEAPVSLDPENSNKGYLLGRLFATYEHAQFAAALGSRINATIKDKFYGAASAQPRRVFALLEKGSANHLSKLGKKKPGYRVVLERAIAAIMASMAPADDPFPASLSAEEQALFGLGYYHQRNEFFKPKKNESTTEEDAA